MNIRGAKLLSYISSLLEQGEEPPYSYKYLQKSLKGGRVLSTIIGLAREGLITITKGGSDYFIWPACEESVVGLDSSLIKGLTVPPPVPEEELPAGTRRVIVSSRRGRLVAKKPLLSSLEREAIKKRGLCPTYFRVFEPKKRKVRPETVEDISSGSWWSPSVGPVKSLPGVYATEVCTYSSRLGQIFPSLEKAVAFAETVKTPRGAADAVREGKLLYLGGVGGG